MIEILTRTKAILTTEPNLVRIDGKVMILGDIRGQFHDLVAMLRKLTHTRDSNYRKKDSGSKMLFLGNYINRGTLGPEVTALLFCLKLKNPSDFILLRGNYETRDMAEAFHFRD